MNDYDGERKSVLQGVVEGGKGVRKTRAKRCKKTIRRRQWGREKWKRKKKRVAGKTNIAYLC